MANKIMNKHFIAFSITAGLGLASVQAEGDNSKPNVVIMLADDMGYSDLSCFDSKNIKTPNLDKLATQGIRFTDFYAAAPNCSPSRAGLLTGRSPSRCGIYNYINYGSPMHLPTSETTIAKLLKQNGYSTCVAGKWHLSGDIDKMPPPSDYGFDHWLCTDLNAAPSHLNPTNFVRNGKAVGKMKGYSCQIVVDEAIGWLKKHPQNKPFFLYVPFHEPHSPLASPPELVAKQRKKGLSKKRALYCANVENLDNAAGRLLKYLDTSNLTKNTLVIFHSDNGSYMVESNAPLRGKKSNVWDGGIRVPGIMRWPGKIKPGTTCHTPVGAVDVLPTICKATGIALPTKKTLDGVNISPLFDNKPLRRRKPLFWFFYRVQPAVALRDGDWSLVGYYEKLSKKYSHPLSRNETMKHIKEGDIIRFELYNYKNDIDQSKNVAPANPERFDKMKKTMVSLKNSIVTEGPTWTFKENQKKKRKRK